ncbi:MAG: phosphoribosylanthranilate isomerase [Alphaproteobacteria bacterium]|nr:phosphoribosylanthranilate isomerase [Alphaproteobacteria bacterium]
MMVRAKICGINAEDALAAAVAGGAAEIGFAFYARSPRAVSPARAAELARLAPGAIGKVAFVVDADDATLAGIVDALRPDTLQLHGAETPERVEAIRRRFGARVMKVISIAGADDVARAGRYLGAADRLLFDAKPPRNRDDLMPGGNGLSFDWQLLARRDWPLPWMLSGGLTPDNVAEAVATSGARAVDVSSGVEDRPGVKSPTKIAAFLAALKVS